MMWQWDSCFEKASGLTCGILLIFRVQFTDSTTVSYPPTHMTHTHIYIPNCRKSQKISVLQSQLGERASQFPTNSHSFVKLYSGCCH